MELTEEANLINQPRKLTEETSRESQLNKPTEKAN